VHDTTSTTDSSPTIFTKPLLAQDLYKIIVGSTGMQK
jgi:hypothetical protein